MFFTFVHNIHIIYFLCLLGWEVAGDHIQSGAGRSDNDYLILTLRVPGFKWVFKEATCPPPRSYTIQVPPTACYVHKSSLNPCMVSMVKRCTSPPLLCELVLQEMFSYITSALCVKMSLDCCFRLPVSVQGASSEYGRITFEFETSCSADCEFYFMTVSLFICVCDCSM